MTTMIADATAAGGTETTNPAAVGVDTVRLTAAQRRALPSMRHLAQGLAEEEGVCARPLAMRAVDQTTGEATYIAVPCKSTLASVCPACARKAVVVRQQQCREGWHLTEEPIDEVRQPTEVEREILSARAGLQVDYEQAKADGDDYIMTGIRELLDDLDTQLRELGVKGPFPPLDPPDRTTRKRSTRRRQEAVDLPRQQVKPVTLGREYAGRYRPSLFVTLTLPSYGRVRPDGSPVDPDSYDYQRAARDIIAFPALFDRFVQNYRRVTGRNVQYFATVEPQRRGAPHIHLALRGTDPRAMVKQLAAATYHQLWWPHFDQPVYSEGHLPRWDPQAHRFVDPDTSQPLPTWDEALDVMDSVDDVEPAHVVRFGTQIDVKGILGGSEQAGRHIGYLTKYLTKSVTEIVEPDTEHLARHYQRLHEQLCRTPCSPHCGVWLLYGISPQGAGPKTKPGQCGSKAHRRDTLGLRGRRVLVSRKWTGKDLTDHRADRLEFVRQRLAEAGIELEATRRGRFRIALAPPGDPRMPAREFLIMALVSAKIRQRAQYTTACLAAVNDVGPPGPQSDSAPVAA